MGKEKAKSFINKILLLTLLYSAQLDGKTHKVLVGMFSISEN